MDPKSAQRQLQAQVNVGAAFTLTSVKLTAIASAAHLKTDPEATSAIAITGPVVPDATTSPLPIGSLPAISTPSPSLTPGGNAAGLFPTVNPSPSTAIGKKASTRAVADTAAMPEGASVVGAQLVGLGALAVAFVLAITRLTIRRRPSLASASAGPAQAGPAQSGTPDAQPGTPDAQPGAPGKDQANGTAAPAGPEAPAQPEASAQPEAPSDIPDAPDDSPKEP